MCTGRSRKRKEAHGGKNKSYNGAAVACSQTDTDTFGFPTALADCPSISRTGLPTHSSPD